ncbi:MAG TPA: hypothetical protein VFW60_03550 [Rhodanobacteraceae bacterium]|nr:hypothetical protein [Rhodanobacteraceae bacterium]
MNRLKLQTQITVDGFNPDGQNDNLARDEVRDYSRGHSSGRVTAPPVFGIDSQGTKT